jgi:hypothetical protein
VTKKRRAAGKNAALTKKRRAAARKAAASRKARADRFVWREGDVIFHK